MVFSPGAKSDKKVTESLADLGKIFQQFFSSREDGIQTQNMFDYEFETLTMGNKFKREKAEKSEKDKIELSTKEQEKTKPWIDIKIDERWMEGKAINSRPRDFGILVHRLFENVDSLDDLDTIKKQLDVDIEITEQEKKRLSIALGKIADKQELRPFFSPEGNVFNEHSIWTGTMFQRPDRVVHSDGRWKILDYKTGAENSEYKKDLNHYSSLLKESLRLEYEPEKCLL